MIFLHHLRFRLLELAKTHVRRYALILRSQNLPLLDARPSPQVSNPPRLQVDDCN